MASLSSTSSFRQDAPRESHPLVAEAAKLARQTSRGSDMVMRSVCTTVVEVQNEDDEPSKEAPEEFQPIAKRSSDEGQGSAQLSFAAFLAVLSKVRQWLRQRLREDVERIFTKYLNFDSESFHSRVLSRPHICRALETLEMAPQNLDDQQRLQKTLDEFDLWGFDQQNIDLDTFLRLVQQCKERSAATERAKERDFAATEYGFDEGSVNEHRLAFDQLDQGTGLDISRVRKVFALFGQNISSEKLRELFDKIDEDDSGVLDFLEYLHLVHELEGMLATESQQQDEMQEAIVERQEQRQTSRQKEPAVSNLKRGSRRPSSKPC